MKKLSSLIILAFTMLIASAQGINFFEGSLEAAKTKAAKKDKLIFVDAYTTWCGPCKMMARDVFTDKEVSAFFNKHFINMKIDQEKGEGIEFAETYDVMAYPTLIFLNANGELAHKIVGYLNVQEFLSFAADALDEEKQILALSKKYSYGYGDPMEPELLKNYANALKDAWMPDAGVVAMDYINSLDQSEWTSPENAEFILRHFPSDIESEIFQFIIANRTTFQQYTESEDELDMKIKQGLEDFFKVREDLSPAIIQQYYQKLLPEDWKEYYEAYEIEQLKGKEELFDAYILAQLAYLEKYKPESWEDFNGLAWQIYQESDEEDILEMGRSIALKSIELDENFYNVDTYTWLCYKLKDWNSVKKYGSLAVRLGESDGFDVSELEEMLESLKD